MLIIEKEPRYPLNDLIRWLSLIFLVSLFISIALCLFLYFQRGDKSLKESQKFLSRRIQLEWLDKGGFSLEQSMEAALVASLRTDIQLFPKNNRPDAPTDGEMFTFSTSNGSSSQKTLKGRSFFIEKQLASFPILASQSVSISPEKWDGGGARALVQIGKNTPFRFYFSSSQGKTGYDDLCFTLLKEIKWWGRDELAGKYGGREYGGYRKKEKIEFSSEGSSYICFIATGDYLIWKKNRWVIAEKEMSTEGYPLAIVKSVKPNMLEIEAWDEQGTQSLPLKINAQPIVKSPLKIESLFSSFRQKSGMQYSCLLGKRRMIIRPGDWILRTPFGWHNLRREQEIEDCFWHRIRGELLIIDGIEKEGDHLVLRGHFFDEMHTQVYNVNLPFSIDKKGTERKKEKK